MNKKWKILIILVVVFLLSGCRANYNVKILLDGKIVESVTLLEEKNNLLDDFTKEKFNDYVDESLKLNGLKDNLDRKKIIYDEDDLAGVDLSKKYKSIDQYVNKSKAISYLFKNIEVEKKNFIYKITSVFSDYEIDYEEYADSTITIELPYKVINSNADIVDEKYNSYTWNIDSDFEGIELEYNSGKLYTNNIFKIIPFATATTYFDVIMFVIIASLVIMIIILGVMLLKKQRKSF